VAGIRAAAVQLCAGPDKSENLKKALRWIDRAAAAGAAVVALPENFLFRGSDRQFRGIPETLRGPSMTALCRAASALRIHVIAGSVAETVQGSAKTYNTSCLIDPSGRIRSVYRKTHLFDVDLPGKRIRESDRCLRGRRPVMGLLDAKPKAIRCGLSICYDLRFPELYREYALLGARILFVPSNFTRQTGRDHWEPLLRARAIENQCFVIAPNQSGMGAQGVLSHGHSMILDPWGRVLAQAPGSGECIITALLDLQVLDRVRRQIPSLLEAKQPRAKAKVLEEVKEI
jgi:deaminated glutathione amidase